MPDRRSVVITGAGSGFGRLTAQKLGALGERVTCLDIDGVAAEVTAALIRRAGGEALAVAADVTIIDDMRSAIAAAVSAHGSVDVMINNAGVMPLAYIAEHERALPAWSRGIDINFKGVMHGCIAVYDQMIAQGRGHVVNISSIYGNHPTAGAAVYGATKAAVDYFSHALRQEARGKIKVTVVKPTGVPATGLVKSVLNSAAGVGIVGHNAAGFYEDYARYATGEPCELRDADSIAYAFLDPQHIADAIVYAVNQPWGVTISDITVRGSGDHYVP